MPNTISSLADGQLPNAKGTLYTVPALTQVFLAGTLVNTDVSARTVNIYVKRSGSTSRRILPKDLSMAAGASVEFGRDGRPFALSAGDIVEGDASAATVVDYLIDGVVHT